MGDERTRVLQMLAEGKITVEEASRLLSLIGAKADSAGAMSRTAKPNAKYLYVRVEPKQGRESKENARVNVRVPISLIRSGMKLTALIPPQVADDINKELRQKGIGFDVRNMKDEYVEQLVEALRDTEIMVDNIEADIRVYAE